MAHNWQTLKKKKKVDFLKNSSCHKIFGGDWVDLSRSKYCKKKKKTNKQKKNKKKNKQTNKQTKNKQNKTRQNNNNNNNNKTPNVFDYIKFGTIS